MLYKRKTQYFIYKLVCDDCDFIYVGSTKSITDRKYQHKQNSKTSEYKVYRMIREYGGWENWRMVIIEECDESIETKRQAEIREEKFRLELQASMNSKRAYRSEEQRKACAKEYEKTEERIAYKKVYRKEYKKTEQCIAYNKAYRKEYEKSEQRIAYNQRPEVKERRNALARERYRLKKESISSSDQHSDTSHLSEDKQEI